MNKNYMAIDQYGETIHNLGKHPRKASKEGKTMKQLNSDSLRLPWCSTGAETRRITETIRDADGRWIADCVDGAAPYLVRAVNSHEALCDALDMLLDILGGPVACLLTRDSMADTGADIALQNARATLDRARGAMPLPDLRPVQTVPVRFNQ